MPDGPRVDDPLKVDVPAWIEAVGSDPVAKRQREVTEIVLNAIALTPELDETMLLKGGVLMGLAYQSPRQTSDLDLTATMPPSEDVGERIRSLLDAAFPLAAARLGYTDLVARVQSAKRRPRSEGFVAANAPALQLKIAYADRGTGQERALWAGRASRVIDADVSFNEPVEHVQLLCIEEGRTVRAYAFADLVAEKYRAMMQQVTRDRNRRQDTYDLDRLVGAQEVDEATKTSILRTLHVKCAARGIEPERATLRNPEIERRSGADWASMAQELGEGELPDFEDCFARVVAFYEALPWAED